MSRRLTPRRSALVAALITFGLVWFGPHPAAGAGQRVEVTVEQVSWWSSRVGASETDDGGFEVAAGPTGAAQSVAAVALSIDATKVTSLPVTLVESAALAEFSSIVVCRTFEDFGTANPGDIDDAPGEDCTSKVNLTRTIDSKQWLGDLGPLVRNGGDVSLMFFPEHTPPTPVGPGMLVSIAELQVEATGSTAPKASTTTTTLPSLTPELGGDGFGAPVGSSFDGPTTGGFDVPPGGGFDAPESNLPADTSPEPELAADTTDDAGGATGGGDTDDGFFALDPIDEASSTSKPWIRLIALVPLSAGIGWGTVRLRDLLEARNDRLGGAPVAPA